MYITCACKLDAEWAEKLTQMSRGKHHIGDFLPPEELEKFMETYNVSFHVFGSGIQPCTDKRLCCMDFCCCKLLDIWVTCMGKYHGTLTGIRRKNRGCGNNFCRLTAEENQKDGNSVVKIAVHILYHHLHRNAGCVKL